MAQKDIVLEVTVKEVENTLSGVSQAGNAWAKQGVVANINGYENKPIHFEIWGLDRIKRINIQPDRIYNIYLDLESRKSSYKSTGNGFWINSFRCYDAREVTDGEQQHKVIAEAAKAAEKAADNSVRTNQEVSTPAPVNDLPF